MSFVRSVCHSRFIIFRLVQHSSADTFSDTCLREGSVARSHTARGRTPAGPPGPPGSGQFVSGTAPPSPEHSIIVVSRNRRQASTIIIYLVQLVAFGSCCHILYIHYVSVAIGLLISGLVQIKSFIVYIYRAPPECSYIKQMYQIYCILHVFL